MMFFYFYKIEFWDNITETVIKESGFLREKSYTDAVQAIVDWYDDDNINSMQIFTVPDGDGPLTLSIIKDIFKEELNES